MKAYWLDDEAQSDRDPITLAALADHGVIAETLELDPVAYGKKLTEYQEERGYGTRDEIALFPSMENLDAICAKFLDEHHHEDDEVRFVLEGEGIFDIRSNDDEWMRIVVQPGDLIIVPAGKHHRFMLTDSRTIKCVRLFQDPAGWAPVYRHPQSSTPQNTEAANV
jgi:1,2-dihydroxy-3-keto-5-methylthiopentene dioxygenase